jgi:GINS complex subunit 2
VPPPWLSPMSLEAILAAEMEEDAFSPNPKFPPRLKSKSYGYDSNAGVTSPPFLAQSTIEGGKEGRLPYHWFELASLLLAKAPDSFINFSTDKGSGAENVRRLLRDIREVRKAKLRSGMKALEGGGVVSLRGVGGMEVSEERGYVVGIVQGLRMIGASREGTRREREGDGGEDGVGGGEEDDDGSDMDL